MCFVNKYKLLVNNICFSQIVSPSYTGIKKEKESENGHI